MAGIEYTLTYTVASGTVLNYFPLGVDGVTAAPAGTKFVVKYLAVYTTVASGITGNAINVFSALDNMGTDSFDCFQWGGTPVPPSPLVAQNVIATLIDASAPNINAQAIPVNQIIMDQSWLGLVFTTAAGGNINVTITFSLIAASNILSNNFLTAKGPETGIPSPGGTTVMLASGLHTQIIKSIIVWNDNEGVPDTTAEVTFTGPGGTCTLIPTTNLNNGLLIYFDAPIYMPPTSVIATSISLVSVIPGGGNIDYYISYTSDPRE